MGRAAATFKKDSLEGGSVHIKFATSMFLIKIKAIKKNADVGFTVIHSSDRELGSR